MLPVLQIGPFAVQTYLLSLFLGAWAGLALSARAARRLGLDGDHVYNAGLTGLLGGLVAARIAHVIAFWPAYRAEPLAIVGLNPRALLFWPGVAGALLVAAWYMRRYRLPTARVFDAALPGFLLAAAIADAGALLAGQDVGAPARLPWAIELWGVPRHPSQVYEALAALLVLGIVLGILRRGARPGVAGWIGVMGYGLSRWLLEPFRADSATMLGGMRSAQVLGLAAALVALWALRSLSERPRPPAAPG